MIAIFGPTGVGKTAVAVAVGELLRKRGQEPVAISADALQVYEGLEVLTGWASAAERERLEHRLIGFWPIAETFSVGQFMPLAHAEIDAALAAGRVPIVVGGTGLYLRAALCELDLRGSPAAGEQSQLWSEEVRHPTKLVGLVMDRERLYERIDARADAITAAGALEEVRAAERAGASQTARVAVGYRELLDGDLEAMRRRSRNSARRQLTWMRKMAGVTVLDVTDREARDVAAEIVSAVDRDS